MMKKTIILLMWLAVLQLSSCISNDFPDGEESLSWGPAPLSVKMRIEGSASTRAIVDSIGTDDEWSYVDFTPGDEMGFFSSGGNFTGGNNGESPFINQRLIYIGGVGEDNFRDPNNTQFSPSHINGNEIFMYFPYTPDINGEFGVELRTNVDNEGERLDTARCMDFLSTRHLEVMNEQLNVTAALYGEFQHTFAELIIMRGEGFDNPPHISDDINEWEIKAVLNTPVTGIKAVVTTEGGWKCTPELIYDSIRYADKRSEMMEWYAWLGANFYKSQEDPIGQTAWYVIVPTIGSESKLGEKRPGPRTRVEYIELYDNDGNLQRVSSLLLSNANSKYVDGGWRYPMEISMKELVPTANPCQIVPWNDNVDLTDERKRGINNESDFDGWVKAYNAYIEDPSEVHSNALFQYGDLYKNPAGDDFWHFYVLNDLNLSSYREGPIVKELRDILDGKSTEFSNGRFQNHTITGLTATFIGKTEGVNAKLENFVFSNPNVNYPGSNTSAVGIISNIMESGSMVENCQIRNGTLYNPGGPAGMVAGTVNDCTIKDCYISGFLISSQTEDNIVGQGQYFSEGNNANNVTNQNKE